MTSQPPMVPPGFAVSERTGPFVDLIGPLYVREGDEAIVLGLAAAEKHANARGFVHAAVLTCLLDLACGRNVAANGTTAAITASLNVDYVRGARVGDWMEATASVTRRGRGIAFATGVVTVSDAVVATAAAVFAVADTGTGTGTGTGTDGVTDKDASRR